MNSSISSYSQMGQSAELNKDAVKAALAELKLEKKRAYDRAHKEQKKAYRAANADKIRAQKQGYNLANADKIKVRKQGYYQANKEEINLAHKAYNKAHPKSSRIITWRQAGVKLRPAETWDGVYKKYIMTINCESCNIELNESVYITRRNLDHDHNEPNYIRGTICHHCNIHDSWRTRMTADSIYQKYI